MATPTTTFGFEFTVQRCEPELVAPAKATPLEFKQLSDIDHQISLQYHAPFLQFFGPNNHLMQGRDPAKVIKEALAKALVFYYPFAGRLIEGPDKKLMVDCTDEGVLFIEADADVTLEQFGDPIQPPFPCFDQLLHNVPGSDGILNCPLLLFQVTRLKCGGFIVANRFNHAVCDGIGIVNFLICVGEMARGANAPSILPVWEREVLNARDPPCITCTHNEYVVDEVHVPDAKGKTLEFETMLHRSFCLGPDELSNIGRLFPSHLQPCTKFEMLTACIWKCYAIASQSPDPNEEMCFQVTVNARTKFNPPIPKGYYGNVIAMPVAITTVGNLCSNSLGYALELVRNAKFKVTEEYMKSLADLIVIKRGQLKSVQPYELTDLRHIGYDQVDYGWGEAMYSGTPNAWPYDNILGAATYYLPFKNKKGEPGIMMSVSLHAPVMERFAALFEKMLK